MCNKLSSVIPFNMTISGASLVVLHYPDLLHSSSSAAAVGLNMQESAFASPVIDGCCC